MNQRGSLTVEFTILVPVLVLMLGMAIGSARAWLARGTVEQVASAAARAATMEKTPDAARAAARKVAAAQVAVGDLRCEGFTVDVDASALLLPAGRPGEVTARVSCAVPLADVLVPLWPGTLTVEAAASAVNDRYQERR